MASLWLGAVISLFTYSPTSTPPSHWEKRGPSNCSDMVIVAGVSKTGVTSLTQALREMGYNTFCLPESLRFHFDFWHHLLNGKIRRPDFCRLYTAEGRAVAPVTTAHALTATGSPGHVTAISGGPVYYFTEEIMQDFPRAKVILSVRDMGQWFRSFDRFYHRVWAPYRRPLNVIFSLVNRMFRISEICRQLGLASDNGFWDLDRFAETLFHPQINEVIFDHPEPSEFLWTRAHQRHVHWVQAVVPPEQLLLFNVSEHGWLQLCSFLGADRCPNSTFPWFRKAEAGYEDAERKFMMAEAFRWQFSLTAATGILAMAATACSLRVKHKAD